MKLFFYFLFCISLASAETINVSNNINDVITRSDTPENNVTITDDNNESNQTVNEQKIFLSYEDIPSKVIVNQQFSIKVKAIVTTKDFDKIKNESTPQKNIIILNSEENWTKKDDYTYFKTFYFRAKNDNITFPQIYCQLYKNEKLISSQEFPKLSLNIIKLNKDKYFSNVVADYLDILKVKTTKFDENNLMVVLEMKAKNANLEDFKLPWVIRDGIDSHVDNFPLSEVYYYAIVPKFTNKFVFSYFNVKQNRFIKKTVDLVIDNENISTQSDLNPQENSFNLYKNITYVGLAIILLFIYYKRRRIIYLIFFVILVIMFFSNINLLKDINISKNSKIFILPTKNSTIFYITPKALKVQKINTREDYIKIILPNGKIGWVKEKNVIHN